MAFAGLRPPAPGIGTAPPAGRLVVQLPTWLWLSAGWVGFSSTASLRGVTETVVAAPQVAVWAAGDGGGERCLSAGHPYNLQLPDDQQSTDCSHTYSRSAAGYRLSVRVTYTVRWNGAYYGEVTGPAAAVPVTVTEIQAVSGPGQSGP